MENTITTHSASEENNAITPQTTPEEHIFGGPITEERANELYNEWVQLKTDTIPAYRQTFKDNPKAVRYYCGRGDNDGDLCYLFSKEILEGLLQTLEEDRADGIVLFNAIRPETNVITDTAVSGRPTLLLFPYTLEDAPGLMPGEKNIHVATAYGYEHPGTGGTQKPPVKIVARGDNADKVPVDIPIKFPVKGVYSLKWRK